MHCTMQAALLLRSAEARRWLTAVLAQPVVSNLLCRDVAAVQKFCQHLRSKTSQDAGAVSM